ncbi:hypothetical protein CASFOL_000449 [Castilleja foliolosa]|uniref:COP1-interacting protein 4.1 n=1 Tax=Castilleja foliolosa TaxID=1961234 RepID=A0ABD3ENR1_9LAMI
MATNRHEPDSDGIITETAEYTTVFVDTSLDTHLAILVSKSDTVSDFKKKIVLEHLQCFPKIMDIRIQSLKVQCNATFYHLPDSMYIWSAFHGAEGNWFLTADASSTSTCHSNTNSSEHGLTKSTTMDVRNVDNSCRGLLSDTNRIQPTIPISPAEMVPGFTVKDSLENTADIQNSNYSSEKCTETESLFKKKRKRRRTEDVCRNPSSKDTDALFHASVTDAVMPVVVYGGKSMVDAVKEGLNLCEQQGILTEVSGLKNDQSVLDNRVVFKGLSVPAVGEMSNLGSNGREGKTMLENRTPENLMANTKEYELGHDVVSMDAEETAVNIQDNENTKSETTSIQMKKKKKKARKSDNNDVDKSSLFQPPTGHNVGSEKRELDEENQHSAGNDHVEHGHDVVSMDAQEIAVNIQDTENPKSDTISIRKKKKTRKSAYNDIDKSGLFQLPTGHDVVTEKREPVEEIQHSAGNDHVELGHDVASMDAHETAVIIQDTENPKSETTSIGKKRKKARKSANNDIDKSALFQPPTGHDVVTEKREPVEEIQHSAGNGHVELGHDVASMDAHETAVIIQDTENPKSETTSIGKKRKKARKSSNNDIDKSALFQPPTGHDVGTEKREPDEENKHSAGNGHVDIPVVENYKNTDNIDKRAKKKRKKKTLTTSDALGDFAVEDQKNGTREKPITFVNFESDGIHEASSEVPSRQSEEKLEEKHEIAVKTDDPARTTKDEGETINFKEYFVPCEVKNANLSSMEMKSMLKVKTPYVSISTDVQSSSKLSADHESKNESRFSKDSGKRRGDTVHKSDLSRRSARDLENGVKDSSDSVMPEINLLKPKEIIAESSTLKKKNASLVKPIMEKFPGKSGDKRSLFGLNVTNRMEPKTPKYKSLLSKTGPLFKDYSSESSGDENGTAHLSSSTRSPSDSSSKSDHSLSESNLSKDSTRNGSSDARERSTGGQGTSKLHEPLRLRGNDNGNDSQKLYAVQEGQAHRLAKCR